MAPEHDVHSLDLIAKVRVRRSQIAKHVPREILPRSAQEMSARSGDGFVALTNGAAGKDVVADIADALGHGRRRSPLGLPDQV